jgi:hypothetical protein
MIRLWRTKKLAEQLRHQGLSEKERLLYFLVFCIGFMPKIQFALIDIPFLPMTEHWFVVILTVAIIFGGAWRAFQVGYGPAKVNFFERFVCLSVPLGIKLLVLEFIVRFAAIQAVSATWASEDRVFSSNPIVLQERASGVGLTLFLVTSVVSLVFLLLFFVRMQAHLAYSRVTSETPNTRPEVDRQAK